MDQFYAARHGDLQQLRVALTVNNVNDVYRASCWTVLHHAANNGYEECVKYCLEMDANVNARNRSGSTPLHIASWHVNVVRVLLEAGAMVDPANNNGVTPLCFAIRNNCVYVSRLLIDRGAKVSNVQLKEITFVKARCKCRLASITVIGIHKYHRTTVTGNNDINVLRLISKHIWSSRMDDGWMDTRKQEKRGKNNRYK
jgi:ankyrin repeat protein